MVSLTTEEEKVLDYFNLVHEQIEKWITELSDSHQYEHRFFIILQVIEVIREISRRSRDVKFHDAINVFGSMDLLVLSTENQRIKIIMRKLILLSNAIKMQ